MRAGAALFPEVHVHDVQREKAVTFPVSVLFFRLCCGGVDTLEKNSAASIKVLKVAKWSYFEMSIAVPIPN